ncbi:MAG: glycosyltransferase family 2 protein [Actinomycetota bacterium]
MAYDISVVTLNYNTRDLLEACLTSLREHGGGLRLELIVVDNASGDGSAQMVRERFPEVRLVESAVNVGCAAGDNLGIELASAPYVLIFDADTAARPGAIKTMLEYMEGRPDVGMVGPRLVSEDGTYQQSCHYFTVFRARYALLLFLTLIGSRGWGRFGLYTDPSRDGSREAEVDWVYTACALIRREVFDTVGLLDEYLFFGGDDLDLCYRAAKAGWKTVYLPQAEIIHHGSRSSVQVFGDLHGLERARTRAAALDHFQRKHFSAAHSYAMRGMLALGSLAISLLLRTRLLFVPADRETAMRAERTWYAARAYLSSMFAGSSRPGIQAVDRDAKLSR